MTCLCASAVLGFWLHVRDPVGTADYAHPGLEVATGAVRGPNSNFSYFQQRRYINDWSMWNKTGGELSLSVLHSGFLRVLALTYCRDAPPRLWKRSDTSPNRTGGPCLKQRLLPLKRWDADLTQGLEAANVPTAVVSVQDNRGQIKDLFTPQLRSTTLILLLIWLGIVFLNSYLILICTWPNPRLSIVKVFSYILLLRYYPVDARPVAVWEILQL